MPPAPPTNHGDHVGADQLFDAWLGQATAGSQNSEEATAAFEALCAAHPGQAAELRRLHSAWLSFRWSESAASQAPGQGTATPLFRGRRAQDRSVAPGPWNVAAGRVLGDFRLVERIGRGGMGEVWEAEQLSLARRVALKLLLPERVDERGLDFFAREARAGGKLAHPGVVAVYGTGESEGLHWIAMELVEEACDLRHSIDGLREADELDAAHYSQTAEFMAELADALDAVHAGGVIHRDLKPGNILVTPDDRPKLTDFGLAKLVGELSLSTAGDLAGTYYYMSPEQVAAKRMGLDHRTDIFSLGVVMYEMLTLTKPFEGDTSEQVAHKVMVVDPPSANEVRSKVPRDLAVICAKAMEKNREARYGSMAEFAADLRRHLADKPILAKPSGPLVRLAKWARRNPTKSAAAGVAVVALVAISAQASQLALQKGLLETERDKLADSNAELESKTAEAERNADLATERAAALEERRREAEAAKAEAEQERDRADLNAEQAEEQRVVAVAAEASTQQALDDMQVKAEEVKQLAYILSFQAADAAFRIKSFARSRSRLNSCPEELRGWEWGHLDLTCDQSLQALAGHGDFVSSVAWNPAGTLIVSGSVDKTLRIWDAATGESLQTLAGHESGVSSVAWNPAGTRIVSGSWDNTLRIWDAATGESLQTLEEHEYGVYSVAWNPAGTRIVSGSNDLTLRIWDAATGESLQTLEGHESGVLSVAWNPAGTRIVSGSDDDTLRIWDAATGESLQTLKGHESNVYRVAWNPAGTRIVSGSNDDTLRIWDAATGESLQTLTGHEDRVPSVAWNPAGTRIVSGSADNTLRIWDAATGESLQTLAGHEYLVTSVAWNPAGTRIVSGSLDNTLRIWDAATGESLQALAGHESGVFSVAWNPAGTRIVSGSDDNTLRILDAATGESLQTLVGHEDDVNSVAWNPVDTRISSGSDDNTLRIWDATAGESLRTLEGHENVVVSVAWNPAGTRIVSGSDDNTLRIWDAATGKSLQTLKGHESAVSSVAWNPAGTRIVSGSWDRTLRIWDAATGGSLQTLWGHENVVFSVAWHPAGTRIVSGSNDDTLRIWDAATGESLQTLTGHESTVFCAAWNHAGTRIVSGSDDDTLRIWDASTGESLQTLTGHEDRVYSVAWNPAGTRIVSGSYDNTLRIWESRLDEALPMWQAAPLRHSQQEKAAETHRLKEKIDDLFAEHVFVESVLEALRTDPDLSDADRQEALQLAPAREIYLDPDDFNDKAWALVDPDREDKDTDVALALRLTRMAIEIAPENSNLLDTHAWALFANGLHAEALTASALALELAPGDDKDDYQGYVDRMRSLIEAAAALPAEAGTPR